MGAGATDLAGRARPAHDCWPQSRRVRGESVARASAGELQTRARETTEQHVCFVLVLLQLLANEAYPSLVGKGAKTVYDENERRSVEIGANRVKLAADFELEINKQVPSAGFLACWRFGGAVEQLVSLPLAACCMHFALHALPVAFLNACRLQVESLRGELMHPQRLRAQLHKLVIYRPGVVYFSLCHSVALFWTRVH